MTTFILSILNLIELLSGSYLVFEAIMRMEEEDKKFRDHIIDKYGLEGEEFERWNR